MYEYVVVWHMYVCVCVVCWEGDEGRSECTHEPLVWREDKCDVMRLYLGHVSVPLGPSGCHQS